jgi:hypothetical protein
MCILIFVVRKTPDEVKQLKVMREEKDRMKAARRQQQEENVKRLKLEAEQHRLRTGAAPTPTSNDDGENDVEGGDEYYTEQEEPMRRDGDESEWSDGVNENEDEDGGYLSDGFADDDKEEVED